MKTEQIYQDGSYLNQNPSWHREDSRWKANLVTDILENHNINPQSICEVGCGSGDILRHLRQSYPKARLVGYDISPQASQFWTQDINNTNIMGGGETITFVLADFHDKNTEKYDVLLMLDVFEHVRDPHTFLEKSRIHADKFVFHIPLDLSASSVIRGKPLLEARSHVGHLHFYTKDLALETLRDCGYKIIEWCYTGAALNMSNRSFRTKLAKFPRLVAYTLNKDWGVRLLGGETLIVIAE